MKNVCSIAIAIAHPYVAVSVTRPPQPRPLWLNCLRRQNVWDGSKQICDPVGGGVGRANRLKGYSSPSAFSLLTHHYLLSKLRTKI